MKTLTMYKGMTTKATNELTDAAGRDATLTELPQWTVSDPRVALCEVSKDGRSANISSLELGTTIVTMRAGEACARFRLNVVRRSRA